MHSFESIERRLRLPAPDEPAILPTLVLPTGGLGSGFTRSPVRAGSTGSSFRLGSARLVFVLLLLTAAVVGAVMVGAIRLDGLPKPFTAEAPFTARGVSIAIPEGWVQLTPDDPFGRSTAATALVASSTQVEGCTPADVPVSSAQGAVPSGEPVEEPAGRQYMGYEDQIFECALTEPMAPGELRLALTRERPQVVGVGFIEPFDPKAWFGAEADSAIAMFYIPSEEDGWTETIDGMPAKVVAVAGDQASGADEVRTWGVFDPRSLGAVWYIRFALRGPDVEPLREQADAIAKSLRFQGKPPALDDGQRDAMLAKAIDGMDREFREFRGTRLFGCFPRTAGEQTVVLEYGPAGPLQESFTATCRTTVETTPLLLWRARMVVSWEAIDGHGAGEWGWEAFFGLDPSNGAQGELDGNFKVDFPGTDGPLPSPLSEPLDIPIGSVVEVLSPGIDQTAVRGPIQELYEHPNATIADRVLHDAQPGRRLAIVDGPIDHRGTNWYLVEAIHGTSMHAEFVWAPATNDDRPLLAIVEPDCPEGPSVEDLVWLIPAERVACFGSDELTFDLAFAAQPEQSQGGGVDGTPDWLARDSAWQLFGEGGPGGVEGGMAVAIHPAVGTDLPTDVALRVRGHFDDPAAATCERTFPEGWGSPETPAMQHLRCRQTFVVTAVEEASAP